MTIQEAIKSGRRFRRKGWGMWYVWSETHRPTLSDENQNTFDIILEDLLAEDWEVEGLKVEVTHEQLCQIYKNWRDVYYTKTDTGFHASFLMETILNTLFPEGDK
jgi:hypothetical protein